MKLQCARFFFPLPVRRERVRVRVFVQAAWGGCATFRKPLTIEHVDLSWRPYRITMRT